MAMKTGMRVVRGPDWKHANEDGGEGFLGTVVGLPGKGPGQGKAHVVWDAVGQEKIYFAGKDNKFELAIYDIGQIGVKHKSVTCDACKTDGITGMRWKCAVCTDYDLCSACYFNDRHDRGHSFMRYVTDDCKLVKVPPRNASTRKDVFGLVKGAEVARGFHWCFGNQDGGPGKRGRITDVGTFSGGHFRGGVRVIWDHKPDNPMGYKVGAEGKVDLVAKSKTSGGTFYPDHLPRLDVINPDHVHLKKSDKVQVDVDMDTLKKLQKEHQSGWNDGMKQCLQEVGTLVSIPHPSIMRLQYEDARIWSVVRPALRRLSSFSKGDLVTLIDSYNAAVELQVGHGGWNDKMEFALGKTGRVLEIDSDGDLKVEVGGMRWLFSPVCCTINHDPKRQNNADVTITPPLPDGKFTQKVVSIPGMDCFKQDNNILEYFQACQQGDLDKVKAFVTKHKDKINVRVDGSTALHMSCNRGHLDIVIYLLEKGAEKNVADSDGDTPLHVAVDGEQDGVVTELCKQGALKNSQNKRGQTPLHRAVVLALEACVSVLVNNGVDVNIQDKDQNTPMHDAILGGKKEVITALLQCAKLDGSKVNSDKLNIMHVAVINNQQTVVSTLIQRDKRLASVTGGLQDFSPLHLAAMNGCTAVAGILVKQGEVQVNQTDKTGRTPLHYAVQGSENTIIDLLLGRGEADPNIQDVNGNTPAHLAQMPKVAVQDQSKREDEVLVQSILCMLVECGADLYKKNKVGKTPLDLCKTPELVQKLKSLAEAVKTKRHDVDGLPPHWSPMMGKDLVIQELKPSDPLTREEYSNVQHKFHRSMANVEIISIKRVQNHALWSLYNVTKRTMEKKYGLGCANELTLFHGTPANSVEPIQHQNIDPLLAGNNVGAIWGKGAYFAVDAKQSDNYASASDEGFRFMYMARVLAGRCAQGGRALQRPPPVDDSRPNELADTCVDTPDQPRIYVVFRNQQIYPEFVIQYM